MTAGQGLRIMRIEDGSLGNNNFPFFNSGPRLPSELIALCVEHNAGLSPTDDHFVVWDEDNNPFASK